jgi:hypothetical protein
MQAPLDDKQPLRQLFFPEEIAVDGNPFNRTGSGLRIGSPESATRLRSSASPRRGRFLPGSLSFISILRQRHVVESGAVAANQQNRGETPPRSHGFVLSSVAHGNPELARGND